MHTAKPKLKTSIILAISLVFYFISCQSGEKLIWSEEFDYTGLPDPKVWAYDLGDGCPNVCGWGNNETQYYTENLAENARVENGLLVLEALKGADGRWTSARLKTLGKKEFRYGKFRIRAKIPGGSGIWPALWMLGTGFTTEGWPACGEIDIMEHVGKVPDQVHATLHSSSSYGNSENTGIIKVADLYNNFHVFGADWTPEKIAISIDGEVFYTYSPDEKNEATWPFDKKHFLILNIAVGGNWGSDVQFETGGLKNGIDPALTSVRMEVDYIRVFE